MHQNGGKQQTETDLQPLWVSDYKEHYKTALQLITEKRQSVTQQCQMSNCQLSTQ